MAYDPFQFYNQPTSLDDRFRAAIDAQDAGVFDKGFPSYKSMVIPPLPTQPWGQPGAPPAPDFASQQLGPKPVQTVSYPRPQGGGQPQLPPMSPQQQPPLNSGLDAINSMAGPASGTGQQPQQPPQSGPLMPAAPSPRENPETGATPWNAVGEGLQGIGASLMSVYDPKGGAVLADLQKQSMASRQKPGKFTMHYDPTTGQLFRIDNQTGQITLGQAGAKPTEDEYAKEYKKKNAEAWVKRNTDIIDQSAKSGVAMGDAMQLKTLLANPDVYQGPGSSLFLQFKTLANNMFPGSFKGVDDSALAQTITNKMALELRNPALGGGMPGSMSDNDLKFLRAMPPGLENSREANPKIADYWIRLSQRSQDIDKLRDAYVQKFGRLDDGFQRIVSEYSAKNHLFSGEKWDTPAAAATPGAGSPTTRPPLDTFRIR